MRKILAWIVLLPAAGGILLFAIANRHSVSVSLDPFSSDAAYAAQFPLFLVIVTALVLGILIGGTAVWFGKFRWQLAAQRAERELQRLRDEKTEAERRAAALAIPRILPPDRSAN